MFPKIPLVPKHSSLVLTASLLAVLTRSPQAQSCSRAIDLRTWTVESYPRVTGDPDPEWRVDAQGTSVVERFNSQPTLFVSDFDAQGSVIEGRIQVNGGDNDIMGFAIGYRPGDRSNHAAEYLLIDWKRADQRHDFNPNCTDGEMSYAGLAVSRVFGVPTADELWGHTNPAAVPCSDAENGVEELARATNRGHSGWAPGVPYRFRFEFSPTNLRVFVNGLLEIGLNGNFRNGRFAFYDFSQPGVEYSAFSRDVLATVSEYGNDSPGTQAVPTPTFMGLPRPGAILETILTNPWDARALGCLLIGTAPASTRRYGIEILVQEPLLKEIPIAFGPLAERRIRWAVPPTACGDRHYLQLVFKDPVPPGLAASRGAAIQVGN